MKLVVSATGGTCVSIRGRGISERSYSQDVEFSRVYGDEEEACRLVSSCFDDAELSRAQEKASYQQVKSLEQKVID